MINVIDMEQKLSSILQVKEFFDKEKNYFISILVTGTTIPSITTSSRI
jgi:hypothetical protein